MENILEIKDLHTYFYTEDSVVKAVEGLSLSVKRGEALGLVGESACGKTVSAYSVMRLIQEPGKIVKGGIIFEGRDILKISETQMQKIRGKDIALVFQEPSMALNPLYTVGFQIGEAIQIHRTNIKRNQREEKVLGLLKKVGIPEPEITIKDYPHNLSGGQAQRVVIAMALSSDPKLLIADEPTTSLDVTIQAQIMDLFLKLKAESGFTFILITHNLALCSEVVDRVAIMYSGRIVELATIQEILAHPRHPYTQALFSSLLLADSSGKRLKVIEGVVADPSNKPSGCHFHPRCPFKEKRCQHIYPEYRQINPNHWVSCHWV